MSRNRIIVMGDPVQKEGVAGAAITPGQLVNFDASGDLVRHAGAGENAAPAFALERSLTGDNIDDDYAADDTVIYGVFRPGDEVYALLDEGEDVSKGDLLESAGNGNLQEHTPQDVDEGGVAEYTIHTRAVVARALEDVDASVATARIIVEVL